MSVKNEASSFGSMGGKANFKKNGKAHMARIGAIGAKNRWAKKKAKVAA